MALYLYFHERLMCFFFAENCFLSRTIGCSKRYAYSKTTRKTRHFKTSRQPGFCWMGRSGENQNKSSAFAFFSLSEVARLCNRLIIQIRCRDPCKWIVFSEKGRHPKFVNRKWQIEENRKEQSTFTFKHYRRLPEA